eukprot:g48126.t1
MGGSAIDANLPAAYVCIQLLFLPVASKMKQVKLESLYLELMRSKLHDFPSCSNTCDRESSSANVSLMIENAQVEMSANFEPTVSVDVWDMTCVSNYVRNLE